VFDLDARAGRASNPELRNARLQGQRMNLDNKTARIVGIFFLFGFAGIPATVLSKSVLDAPDYLLKVSESQHVLIWAAFFQLIMALACASIGVWLYPVLRKHNETLAFGAAGFRLIEGVLYFIPMIGMLALIPLSREYVQAGAPANSYYRTLGTLIRAACDDTNNVFVLTVWCLGASMYYYVFYRTRILPRWWSSWGLVGVSLTICSSICVMFRVIRPMSTIQVLVNLPIALQELVMAVWLIVKGFDSAARESRS
jgi:hypothetical protein